MEFLYLAYIAVFLIGMVIGRWWGVPLATGVYLFLLVVRAAAVSDASVQSDEWPLGVIVAFVLVMHVGVSACLATIGVGLHKLGRAIWETARTPPQPGKG